MAKGVAAASLAVFAASVTCNAQRVFQFNSTQRAPANQAVNSYLQHRKPTGFTEQVSVIGNFGATFTVNGMGAAASGRKDEFIDIVTNRPLTFQAASFTTLMVGGSGAASAGSISYEMQLYYGTSSSVGAPIGSAVSGTDTAFDGATLMLSSGALPGNGQVVLRLSRTLALTQAASGATTYTASGTIVLTVN